MLFTNFDIKFKLFIFINENKIINIFKNNNYTNFTLYLLKSDKQIIKSKKNKNKIFKLLIFS